MSTINKQEEAPSICGTEGFTLFCPMDLQSLLPTAIIAYAFLDYNMQNQWSIPIFWDGSYRIGLFFQSVCSLTTFTPYDKTETAQRLKVPPPTYIILKYYDISAATHTSPIDHTIKEPYTTNNIYQKKVFCIASRLTTTEKDIPTAYPDITQTVQRQPRSPKPDNHTSHSRQEPYTVIMSE